MKQDETSVCRGASKRPETLATWLLKHQLKFPEIETSPLSSRNKRLFSSGKFCVYLIYLSVRWMTLNQGISAVGLSMISIYSMNILPLLLVYGNLSPDPTWWFKTLLWGCFFISREAQGCGNLTADILAIKIAVLGHIVLRLSVWLKEMGSTIASIISHVYWCRLIWSMSEHTICLRSRAELWKSPGSEGFHKPLDDHPTSDLRNDGWYLQFSISPSRIITYTML